ncbi:MAG: hypothetical protein GY714_12540 [Desulfobacterales bacterium]|nr:hypothetical protein [Desulfobacterales bacterium]
MRIKIIILVSMLSLLVSCGSKDVKVTEVKSKAELIEEVYVKSGLSKQVPTFQTQTDQVLKMYEGRLPPKFLKILTSKINKIYDPVMLEKRIKHNMNANISEDVLRHKIKWYNSDLGIKITALEVKGSQGDPKELFSYIIQNKNTKFPQKRVTLLKRFNIAINQVELLTDFSIYGSMLAFDILNDMNPKTKQYTKEQLKQFISTQRIKIRASMEKLASLSTMHTYKSLSNEELLKYVEFLELPKSKVFNDELLRSIFRSIYTKADLTI